MHHTSAYNREDKIGIKVPTINGKNINQKLVCVTEQHYVSILFTRVWSVRKPLLYQYKGSLVTNQQKNPKKLSRRISDDFYNHATVYHLKVVPGKTFDRHTKKEGNSPLLVDENVPFSPFITLFIAQRKCVNIPLVQYGPVTQWQRNVGERYGHEFESHQIRRFSYGSGYSANAAASSNINCPHFEIFIKACGKSKIKNLFWLGKF